MALNHAPGGSRGEDDVVTAGGHSTSPPPHAPDSTQEALRLIQQASSDGLALFIEDSQLRCYDGALEGAVPDTRELELPLVAAVSASSHVGRVVPPPAQRELFGVAARTDERLMRSSPCSRCGATVAVVGPGSGPHDSSLRWVRGHFLRWLPKPGCAA